MRQYSEEMNFAIQKVRRSLMDIELGLSDYKGGFTVTLSYNDNGGSLSLRNSSISSANVVDAELAESSKWIEVPREVVSKIVYSSDDVVASFLICLITDAEKEIKRRAAGGKV